MHDVLDHRRDPAAWAKQLGVSREAIEIYLAASSTLNGPFDGHKDGGAVQIVLTPPTETLAAVGAAFYSPGGGAAPFDALLKATDYAGRLVDGGYEIEMRLPWSADAEAILSGVKIISGAMKSQRDMLILAASFGLCAIVNYAPPTVFEIFPPALRILAGDGIVVGTLVAVLLNLALPAAKPEAG